MVRGSRSGCPDWRQGGQAPSRNPAFAENLVRFGIDSISVDPGAVGQVRAIVGAAEARLVLAAARDDLGRLRAHRA